MNAALNGLLVVHSLPAVDAAADAAADAAGAADAGATDAAAADAGATDGASDAAGVAAELHAANSAVTDPSTTANRTLRLVLLTAMSPCLPIVVSSVRSPGPAGSRRAVRQGTRLPRGLGSRLGSARARQG